MYSEHRSPADAAMAPRSVGATRAYTHREAIVEDRGLIQGLSRRGKTRAEITDLLMRGKPQLGPKGSRERTRVRSLVHQKVTFWTRGFLIMHFQVKMPSPARARGRSAGAGPGRGDSPARESAPPRAKSQMH